MKKKILHILCLGMISILIFTGCYPLSREDEEEAVGNRVTWEEQMENWKTKAPKEIENKIVAIKSKDYSICADVYISDELECYEVSTIRISRHLYEKPDEVLKACMEYFGLKGSKGLEILKSTEKMEGGVERPYVLGANGDENGIIAALSGSSVLIASPLLQDYSNWGLLSWRERMQISKVHAETMMQPTDIELLSEEEVREIKANLESIFGVPFLDNYMLETCTLERLQDLIEYEKTFYQMHGLELDENMRWYATAEDEGTVLWLQQGYEGIPLLFDEPEYSETGASYLVSSYCNVVSSKEGLEGITMSDLYEIHGPEETVQILSLGEFIEKHIEMRGGLQTNVVRIGLYYLPYYTGEGLDFIAKPVWYVQTQEMGETGYPERQSAIYDAVTGEEIPWY